MIAEFIEVCMEEGTLLDEDGECLIFGVRGNVLVFTRVHALISAAKIIFLDEVWTGTFAQLLVGTWSCNCSFEYLDWKELSLSSMGGDRHATVYMYSKCSNARELYPDSI